MSRSNKSVEDQLSEKLAIMQLAVQGALHEIEFYGGAPEESSGLLYSFWELKDAVEAYRKRHRHKFTLN